MNKWIHLCKDIELGLFTYKNFRYFSVNKFLQDTNDKGRLEEKYIEFSDWHDIKTGDSIFFIHLTSDRLLLPYSLIRILIRQSN